MLQRQCACGGTPGPTGECAACRRKRLLGQERPSIQPKLTVNQPGDRYEQEADRVADQVMRMPEPPMQRQAEEEEEELLQTKPLAGPITPLLQRQAEEEEEEEELLQAKSTPGAAPEVTAGVASDIASLRGGGQPLPASARAFFEPRFGRDFSQVRIHADARAARAARSVKARAFTIGHEIGFNTGQYAPGSVEGRRLLAHELTHVVQQRGDAGLHRLQRAEAAEGEECYDLIPRAVLECEVLSVQSGGGRCLPDWTMKSQACSLAKSKIDAAQEDPVELEKLRRTKKCAAGLTCELQENGVFEEERTRSVSRKFCWRLGVPPKLVDCDEGEEPCEVTFEVKVKGRVEGEKGICTSATESGG